MVDYAAYSWENQGAFFVFHRKQKEFFLTSDFIRGLLSADRIQRVRGAPPRVQTLGALYFFIGKNGYTEERKEQVNFSIPYYTAAQVMIVKDGSDIAKASDMEGKKIAVVQGYTGETVVKELGYEYEAFKKGTECVLELVNGKCDVVVIDSATAATYVADNEGLSIVEDSEAFGEEQYAIAVAKNNTELLEKINASLEKMLADGTVGEIAVSYIDAQ